MRDADPGRVPVALSALRFRRGFKIRPQLANSTVECGPACMAMILTAFGRYTTVQETRMLLAPGRDGVSAGALQRLGAIWGLQGRALHLRPQELCLLQLPVVAHWQGNHFVIIERYGRTGASIIDPAVGRRQVSAAELTASFTGVVLEFSPTPALERRRRPHGLLVSFLWPFLPRAPGVTTLLVVCSAVLVLLGLAPAALTRYMVDAVLPRHDFGVLAILGGGLITITVAQALMSFGRAEILLFLETRIDAAMMSRFVTHLFSLPYRYFQLRTGGDLLVRVSSSIMLRDLLTGQALGALLDIGLIAVYASVLAAVSPEYCLIVAIMGVLQVLIMITYGRRAQELTYRELTAFSAAQSCLLETIVGMETVKAAGFEEHAYHRWWRLFCLQLQASVAHRAVQNVVQLAFALVSGGTPLVLLWLGAHQVLTGELTLGDMFALNAIAGSALAPVNTLASVALQLQAAHVHLGRLQDVFKEDSEQDASRPRRQPTLHGRIELDAVTFGYGSDDPPAIHDVTLTCPAHAKIAIVGRTGSGKSTLVKLMLGLYQPIAGQLRFDGIPLDQLDLPTLRRQCGIVMQEPHIFSGTIFENIALAATDARSEDLERAARLAEIHDEIMAMPMAYQTRLSEGGTGLSGGQRQRLAIARALLADPKILLLDEATSHLDAATEARINRNLARLPSTRIVIAHRLSTVRDADLIIVVDQGRVIETGRHEELLSRDSHYAELVVPQLASQERREECGAG